MMKVWSFSHSKDRAVECDAILIDDGYGKMQWNIIAGGYCSPLYQIYETEKACLEAELRRDQSTLRRAQESIKKIDARLTKLAFEELRENPDAAS